MSICYIDPKHEEHKIWGRWNVHERRDGSKYVIIGGLRYTGWSRPEQPYTLCRDFELEGRHHPYKFGSPWGVHSYEMAREAWERAPAWRNGPASERPATRRRSRYSLLRREHDDSISMVEGSTIATRWYPDGRVWVNASHTRAVSAARRWMTLPRGVLSLRYYAGEIAVCTGLENGEGPRYPQPRRRDESQQWHVVNGSVMLRKNGDAWAIEDTTGCRPFRTIEFDRDITRRLSREYHFAEMKMWLTTIKRLSDDEGAKAIRDLSAHGPIDLDRALTHMKDRQFDKALRYLPETASHVVFGRDAYYSESTITNGSIEHARRHAYKRENALRVAPRKVLTLGEYNTWRRKESAFA